MDDTGLFLLGIVVVIVGIVSIAIGVYGVPQYSTATSAIGLILIVGGGFLAYKKGKEL